MNLILAAWIAGFANLVFLNSNYSPFFQVLNALCVMVLVLLWALSRYWQSFKKSQLLRFSFRFIATILAFGLGYVMVHQALDERLAQRAKTVQAISGIFYIAKIGESNQAGLQQQAIRVDVQPPQVYVLQIKTAQLEQLAVQGSSALHNQPDDHQTNTQQSLAVAAQLTSDTLPNPNALELGLGQYYAIDGVLKPAHGYAVPHVFDVERWYLSQNWQGRIKVKQIELLTASAVEQRIAPQILQQHQSLWAEFQLAAEQQRLNFRHTILHLPVQQRGLLLALLTGDRSALSPQTEQLFLRFGLSHLLAISGPHVLLLGTMLCWLLSKMLNRYFLRCYLWQPRPILLMLPFLLSVLLYTAFVGFEIPALRTLLSVSMVTIAIIFSARLRPFSLILVSAALLLWLDPLSILSASFWLSYGACLVLLQVYQSLQKQQLPATATALQRLQLHVQLLWASQWRTFLALLPLVLWIFGQVAWIAPFANLIAIPILGLLVVPLNILAALLSWLLPPLAQLLWHVADLLLRFLIATLNLADANLAPSLTQWSLTPLHIAVITLGMLLLMLPRGTLPKLWMIPCLLPLFAWVQLPPQAQLTVIDVGQGQAILLRDAEQNILIDTGGYYDESRFSIGTQVLLPFLRGEGIRQIDRVILSHLDQDHSGAYPALEQGMPVLALQSNEQLPYPTQVPFQFCQAGQSVASQDFTLQILSPQNLDAAAVHANQNEYSCVVYVQFKQEPLKQNQSYRNFLIMGDAGFAAEVAIMQRYPNLQVDVLVLGHHGSKHSSSLAFLQHYHPKLAVASAGFDNRYGHPSVDTLQRLQQLNIPVLNIANTGTLIFHPNHQENALQPLRETRAWWH